MKTYTRIVTLAALAACTIGRGEPTELRLGMIGLDTPHAVDFTKLLHDTSAKGHVSGAKVVGAYKAGSPEIQRPWASANLYAEKLQNVYGVRLYESIEDLVNNVDAILIESVDARPHLEQVRRAIIARKPIYVEKPIAASLKEAVAIFALAKQFKVELTIVRSSIVKPGPVGMSLMPMGLDRALDPKTLADLIALLKSLP